MITKFVKGALRDILANKMRSFLTVLGILIGISSVTMMVSIGGSAQEYINQSITSKLGKTVTQPGHRVAEVGESELSSILTSFTDVEYEAIKPLVPEYVTYISRRSIASVIVNFADTEETVLLFTVDPGYFKIIDIELLEGRYFRLGGESGQEVILRSFANCSNCRVRWTQSFHTEGVLVVAWYNATEAEVSHEAYMIIETYRESFSKSANVSVIAVAAKTFAARCS
jgi:ABC-type antimicrobial peptide transport system permease subunit